MATDLKCQCHGVNGEWREGQSGEVWAHPKRDEHNKATLDYYPKGMEVLGDHILSIFFEKYPEILSLYKNMIIFNSKILGMIRNTSYFNTHWAD